MSSFDDQIARDVREFLARQREADFHDDLRQQLRALATEKQATVVYGDMVLESTGFIPHVASHPPLSSPQIDDPVDPTDSPDDPGYPAGDDDEGHTQSEDYPIGGGLV